MTSYIEINNSSRVIINDSYKNLSLIKKITSLTWTKSGIPGLYVSNFSIQPLQIPFLGNGSFRMSILNNSVWLAQSDFAVYYGVDDISVLNSNLEIFVYGFDGSGSNCGIQTFNESGELVFDGTKNYLRMLDIVTFSASTSKTYSHNIMATPIRRTRANGKDVIDTYIGITDKTLYMDEWKDYTLSEYPIADVCGDVPILVANRDNL